MRRDNSEDAFRLIALGTGTQARCVISIQITHTHTHNILNLYDLDELHKICNAKPESNLRLENSSRFHELQHETF